MADRQTSAQGGPTVVLHYLLHYANGTPTKARLPVPATKINVDAIARIPGTRDLLAGGYTHASGNQGNGVVSVLLAYVS